ncbi:MAG: glycoside hydrolase family 9 protein [Huintestinicola sp.]
MKKKIHINLRGYMLEMPKTAVCLANAGVFYLIDAEKGVSVYASRLSHPSFDRESGDTVRIADFSDFNTPGKYYIRAGYRRSDVFEISENPYKSLRSEILRGIYLNRCGFDMNSDVSMDRNAGQYSRSGCHTNSAGTGRQGGWHSYGGYNRDVDVSCGVLADMLYALRLFGESFSDKERVLMEDECRWGLDWLLRMQDSDGGVFSSIYSGMETPLTAPEEDSGKYFLGGKTCSAALRSAAVLALASGYFEGCDDEYSHLLRSAAERSWLAAVRSEEYKVYCGRKSALSAEEEEVLESEFMWAMCELYSLTGDSSYSEMIGKKYLSSGFSGFDAKGCGGFAALSYLLSERSRERSVEAFVRKRITDIADRLWIADRGSGYSIACSAGSGFEDASNLSILSDGMTFIMAYLVSGGQKYLTGASDQFSYIFGRNPLGMSFMTGDVGECCCSPCHSLSASFEGGAVPGMIVGGANTSRSDDYSRWHISVSSPPAKCYVDSGFSRATNTPSVHYSAPVIFISAFYDKVGRSALTGIKAVK